MRIRRHAESHIVELDDGTRWRIFPGDLDLTLAWTPDTELDVLASDEPPASHVLASGEGRVRVIAADRDWPAGAVKDELKGG